MALDVKEVKELARKYTPEQIEGCITEQIETGRNVCLMDEDSQKIISELAEAEFVRGLMDGGMSLPDALRELARRMRLIRKAEGL